MKNSLPVIKAINPKLQSKVDRVIKLNSEYDALSNERNKLEGKLDEEDRALVLIDRKCYNKFEKLANSYYELPVRERKNINKLIPILPIKQ